MHLAELAGRSARPAERSPEIRRMDASIERLEREEVVEAILELNPGSTRSWLEEFATEELRNYLAHLDHALQPRGRSWHRPAGVPAAVHRRAA
jgi:hypothetical protein